MEHNNQSSFIQGNKTIVETDLNYDEVAAKVNPTCQNGEKQPLYTVDICCERSWEQYLKISICNGEESVDCLYSQSFNFVFLNLLFLPFFIFHLSDQHIGWKTFQEIN